MKTSGQALLRPSGYEGQALVETAIVFPVLLIFIMGIAQFALILNAHSVVNYAAFCACRSGIVHNADENQMKLAAVAACSPLAGNPLFSYANTSLSKEMLFRQGTIPVRNLRVTVTHYFELQFPLVGRFFSLFWGGSDILGSPRIPVRATCVMRMEDQ